jgi:hypothetical protein
VNKPNHDHSSSTSANRAVFLSENGGRLLRAVEAAMGIRFDALLERANVELEARKQDARRDVLAYLGESAQLQAGESEQIRQEWCR